MRKLNRIAFAFLVAAAALAGLLRDGNTLRASAAEPTTHYFKYICVDESKNEWQWRKQIGEWIDGDKGLETYYIDNGSDRERVKDGDVVVILPIAESSEEDGPEAKSGNAFTISAHLSNLTVAQNAGGAVFTGGVDECYILGGSYASVNGDVTNAYVYDDASCNFNNNVANLRLFASAAGTVDTTVTVVGTVNYVALSNGSGILNEYYNFAANTFRYSERGGLLTDPSNYSASGSSPQASAPASPSGAKAQAASSGEYDDVPKTGEGNLVLWLLILSGVCLAGHLMMGKMSHKM